MLESRFSFVDLVLLGVAIIWGINPPIMKLGLVHILPQPYNAMRMIVAIAVAWLMLILSKKHQPFAKSDWKKMFNLSFFGFFIFQLFFTIGLNKTTAGNSSLLLALLPVSVAIINRIFKIESIQMTTGIGIAASMVGVVLIILGTGKQFSLNSNHLVGGLYLLMAQAGYGYFTVFSKELLKKYSTYQITAYLVTISGVLFLLVSLPSIIATDWGNLPSVVWWSILYSGSFAICIGNFLWVWGVGKLGSTKTAVYNNLPPVFAVTTGYLFLGETFGLLQFFGAVVVFLGVYITRTKGDFFKRNMSV